MLKWLISWLLGPSARNWLETLLSRNRKSQDAPMETDRAQGEAENKLPVEPYMLSESEYLRTFGHNE
jgi:hypothetical protein